MGGAMAAGCRIFAPQKESGWFIKIKLYKSAAYVFILTLGFSLRRQALCLNNCE
jgi:hypothetical protein